MNQTIFYLNYNEIFYLLKSKEDSNSTYLSELFDDEVSSAKSLLNIIKDYEKDEFYNSEVEGLNDIIENFISK